MTSAEGMTDTERTEVRFVRSIVIVHEWETRSDDGQLENSFVDQCLAQEACALYHSLFIPGLPFELSS